MRKRWKQLRSKPRVTTPKPKWPRRRTSLSLSWASRIQHTCKTTTRVLRKHLLCLLVIREIVNRCTRMSTWQPEIELQPTRQTWMSWRRTLMSRWISTWPVAVTFQCRRAWELANYRKLLVEFKSSWIAELNKTLWTHMMSDPLAVALDPILRPMIPATWCRRRIRCTTIDNLVGLDSTIWLSLKMMI